MTREAWNQAYSGSIHELHGGKPSSAPELAGFLAGLPELPSTALDLGCGTGGDAVYLAGLGIDTTGLDFSPAALELAKQRAGERGVTVTWIEGDVLDLPIADASIDLVTDHGWLHHVRAEDQPSYAREVARVLTPGGLLLIREMNHAGHHEHAVSDESIRAMVADVPLRVRCVVPFDMAGPHGAAAATICVLERD